MLLELHVRDLGVIADLTLVLGPGMTALTGETGAGKTLVVEAIELLVGERADAVLVRPGAVEARVEGRFLAPPATPSAGASAGAASDEVVLARAVPRSGRSRAYVDGRLATVGELSDIGRRLIDLHGQHAHQSLLTPRIQREALDQFGRVDLGPLQATRERLAGIDQALVAVGGDARARAREIDLLRFQLGELGRAEIAGPDEDESLEAEEDVLADAAAHRQSGEAAHEALAGDGGAADAVGAAIAALAGRRPFADLEARLRSVAAEIADAGADLRHATEAIALDPERLEAVRARRRMLSELRRKYGEQLSDVLDYQDEAHSRLAELEGHAGRVAALEGERAVVTAAMAEAAAGVAESRRRAAPRLAEAVAGHLGSLAMPNARFSVDVGGPDPADEVTFLIGVNPGERELPLTKVASGGELARCMLAARLVLSAGPPTLVFDEVDAGVGGEAALAVGKALAALAEHRQVLVVTHLPQVAAFAHHQVAVHKTEDGGRTIAHARTLCEAERVVELSRMLSGQPSSATARDHAQELLAAASKERGE